jgi:hypothetical protein
MSIKCSAEPEKNYGRLSKEEKTQILNHYTRLCGQILGPVFRTDAERRKELSLTQKLADKLIFSLPNNADVYNTVIEYINYCYANKKYLFTGSLISLMRGNVILPYRTRLGNRLREELAQTQELNAHLTQVTQIIKRR